VKGQLLRDPSTSVAFRDFYRAHLRFVLHFARDLGVDDASVDDVVQQVFWVAARRFHEFCAEYDAPRATRAWVLAILKHTVLDYQRSIRRKSPHVRLPHIDPETIGDSQHLGPHETLVRIEAANEVRRLIERLHPKKREVFVLAEIERRTALQIADELGVNANTVSSRLRAAWRDFERAAERYRLRDTGRLAPAP
jgi:RNA polymerase sigma-70 factor (ECF subfamily)